MRGGNACRAGRIFFIHDHFKTQEMCIRAVQVDPWQLYYVHDWFVVPQEMWYENFDDDDDDDDDDYDEIIEWHDDYKKRKA